MRIKCKLCEVEARIVKHDMQGYKEGDYYTIVNCPSCESAFPSDQVIDSDIYNYIYKNVDKIPGYNRYHTYYKNIINHSNPLRYLASSEASYWAIDDILSKDIRKRTDIKILEIGCGLGYLTYSLNVLGYDATGLDISQDAIEKAISNFGNTYIKANILDSSSFMNNEYDYIIMTELIEHVEDPMKMIEAACQYLKTDGKLLITTPNKDLYPSNIIWQTELPPIHLWWFSEKFFTILSGKLNKKISFLDFTRWNKTWLDNARRSRSINEIRKPILDKNNEYATNSFSSKNEKFSLHFVLSKLGLVPVARKLAILYYQLLSKDIHRHNVMCIIVENNAG